MSERNGLAAVIEAVDAMLGPERKRCRALANSGLCMRFRVGQEESPASCLSNHHGGDKYDGTG
ncbi:hypothetical protein [Paenibacillus thiaminolyticus]|uniref:Uncharacterized protein n=1 Tax=Paenibacillus thiaminolyticus TaxID=49283 RepID=A0A3A3GNM9_PANTH|nr:hypothetical protein [Paenibacillus thiaminolyticus]RJG25576.1 hypothetical protein DQX05_05665 [Paenibacillus thiaminolyticus]